MLAALNASRGIDQRTDSMTENEKDLFFNLKVELENKRDRVLRYDRMLSRPTTPKRETGIDTITDDFSIESRVQSTLKAAQTKALRPQAAMECELPRKVEADAQRSGTKAQPARGGCLKGYRLVKALSDFGPFACGDGMSIRMVKNDLATLPEDIASVLAQQGLAHLMEGVP